MAKDPALLFYPKDFLSRVLLLKDEDVGKYIRIICLQFINGHLSEKTVNRVCNKFSPVWKFLVKDSEGLYYDPDIDETIQKRNAYCESRRKNAEKRYSNEKNDLHMQHYANANANVNENIKKNTIKLSKNTIKYFEQDIEEAFESALQRSYGGQADA